VSRVNAPLANAAPTIHASAVLVGPRALLIRGPAGSGKSRLALNLIHAAAGGQLAFVRLVADDRVHVEAVHGRVIVRPPAALAGLLEVRGLGIQQLQYEPMAVISLVVDLDVASPPRLPDAAGAQADIAGVMIRRLAVARGGDPIPLVLAIVMGDTWYPGTPGGAPNGTPGSGTPSPGTPSHVGDAPAPAHVTS
jgi:HPr kinase/phosphorylase